jgi:hypothetical protein
MRRLAKSTTSTESPDSVRLIPATLLRLAAALSVGFFGLRASAQVTLDMGAPSPISAGVHQRLDPEFRKRLPGASPAAIERAEEAFIDHLRDTSGTASTGLAAGHIDEDDLSSRIDVFLGDHPELSRSSSAPTEGPRTQILNALKRESDLSRSDAEREALADRFIVWIGGLSGSTRDTLLAGRMPADELQSRVDVFAADIRAERSRVVTDPAIAAIPAIAEAFERANLGPVPERADSICYKGTVSDGKTTRDFLAFKKRPGSVRIHMMKDGFVAAILGFDGTTPWGEVAGKPPVPLQGAEAEALILSSRYDYPLVGFRERGAKVRLESAPGESPIRISYQETGGDKYVESIDPGTYHETAIIRRGPNGKVDETRMQEFRKEGAYTYASVQEHWIDGKLHSTTRISDVRLDPGILTAFFGMPRESNFGFMDMMGGLVALQAASRKEGTGVSLPSSGLTLPPAGAR